VYCRVRPGATSIRGVAHALDKTRTCYLPIRSVKDCVLGRSLMHRNRLVQSVFVGLLYSVFTPVQLLLLPYCCQSLRSSRRRLLFFHICRNFGRVTDGARTRDFGATIRRLLFLGVAPRCRIGIDRLISLLAIAHRFSVLRAEWCQQWCQHPHGVVARRRALGGYGAKGVLSNICFHHLGHTCAPRSCS
jgi:hypothetical protein